MRYCYFLHTDKPRRVAILILLFVSYSSLYAQELAYNSGKYFQQSEDTNSIISVLNKIKGAYDVNFIYEPHVLNGLTSQKRIPKNADRPIETLLKEVLDPLGLTYDKISEQDYVIKKSKSKTSKRTLQNFEINVSGVVIDEDDYPIPGVNVILKGTSNGTVTDVDGKFKISVPNNEAVLIFTFVGYKTQEVTVGNKTTVNVTMLSDMKQLGEVVVTAVGIEADKASLSYSISNVDTESLVKSRETNLVSAMSGKIAGVQVISSSGAPGASATVRIRGSRSLTGSNGPLFVIDGVPVSNSSSGNGSAGVDNSNRAIDINPNDIEKMTVLKGPSATVLYGSRAANGAVMITTKSGKKGKTKITISSGFSISEVNKLPEKQNLYAQGRPSSGVLEYRGPETGENNSWGPLISDLEFDGDDQYPYDKNGRLVPIGTGNGVPAIAYDDYGAFFIKGNSFDNNISASGGNETVRYYFSVGNLQQNGVVPHAGFERTSVKSNIQADLTDKLNAGVSATYSNSGGNRIQRGSNISGFTVGLFRNTPTFDIGNGLKGQEAADNPSSYIFPDHTQRSFRGNGGYDNPFWVVNLNPYTDDVNRVIGNINLTYKVLPWLKLSYKIGLDNFTDSRDFAWDVNSSSQTVGRVEQVTRISKRFNSDVLLLINKDLSEDLNLAATIGHNYNSRYFENKSSEGSNFSIPGFFDMSNASEIMSSRSISREKLYGVFGDVKFGYKNIVYLNLSARNDWSSTLPQGKNSLLYPAGGIGFEFTELIKPIQTIVSYGKLRVSYGRVGNTPSIYQTDTYFDTADIDGDDLLAANEFPFNGVNGFERSGRKENNEIRPEFTTTLEVGADLKFLNGRISLDATYYNAFTDDALVTTTLSAPSGYTSIQRNAGNIENKGVEISLNGVVIESGNGITWEVGAVFSQNKSLVKSLPDDIESVDLASFSAISSINVVGHPYGVLSGTRYLRDEQDRMVIGVDGWPLIDTEQGIIGDPNPDWLMGVNSLVSYKGVSLSFLWDIKQGGDMWNGTKGVMDYLGVSKETGELRTVTGYVFDGVMADDNGIPTDVPNTIGVDFANPALGLSGIKWRKAGTLLGLAEDNIEDASWVRLREITLSYDLPKGILDKLNVFSSASISVYGRNLLLFTEYSGIDPETNLYGASNAQGWDYFNMPNTKSYGVTLKLVSK